MIFALAHRNTLLGTTWCKHVIMAFLTHIKNAWPSLLCLTLPCPTYPT